MCLQTFTSNLITVLLIYARVTELFLLPVIPVACNTTFTNFSVFQARLESNQGLWIDDFPQVVCSSFEQRTSKHFRCDARSCMAVTCLNKTKTGYSLSQF